jgi:16S rRNA processing protein RimM
MGEEFAPPESLVIGYILGPWGMKGEMKVHVVTDFPDRISPGRPVYLDNHPLEIETCRAHRQHLVVKLVGIDTRTDAEKLRGSELTIPGTDLRPLPDGEYYAFQLIGLDVVTTGGRPVGRIVDLMTTGSNDVYVVRGEQGETLVPATEDVVKSIDVEKQRMVIEAIEGLLPSP